MLSQLAKSVILSKEMEHLEIVSEEKTNYQVGKKFLKKVQTFQRPETTREQESRALTTGYQCWLIPSRYLLYSAFQQKKNWKKKLKYTYKNNHQCNMTLI